MSFNTSDEENGEQNTRCVRMSVDITIALTFTRFALFPLRAVKVGRKLECFEGPTSSFRQAFCHPAHHPHDRSHAGAAGHPAKNKQGQRDGPGPALYGYPASGDSLSSPSFSFTTITNNNNNKNT